MAIDERFFDNVRYLKKTFKHWGNGMKWNEMDEHGSLSLSILSILSFGRALTRPDAVPPFDAPRFPHLTRAVLGVQGDGTDGN